MEPFQLIILKMFKIIQTNKINSNIQNEKIKVYKGLILDDVTFS